jgi:hypothetical protein
MFTDFLIVPRRKDTPLSIDNFKIKFKDNFSSCLILSLSGNGNIMVDSKDETFCDGLVVIGNSDAPRPPTSLNIKDTGTSKTFLKTIQSRNACSSYRDLRNLPNIYSDTDYICHWTISSRITSNQCMNFYYSSLFGNPYNMKIYSDNSKSINDLINNIQRIIYTSELNEDITVYRSSRSTIYKKNVSTYNLKIGKTYFQPVFCSTTIYKGAQFLADFSNFESGLAAYVIKIPKGSKVLYIRNCSIYEEFEVLLPLGCSFKINRVDDGKYIKGEDGTYFKTKIYYADYVQPNRNIFDPSSGMKWDYLLEYIRNDFVESREIVLPDPVPFKHGKPSRGYCKDISEFFVKVFEICEEKIEYAKKMITEKIFTYQNLLQILKWFKTIFENILDMFDYLAPLVWFYFNKIVIGLKDFILLNALGILPLSSFVINTVFSGIEYLLTLGLSGYSKENLLQYFQNKKLKV